MKIYRTDKNVPYKSTKINHYKTKEEIEKLLRKWGVKDIGWRYDPENNDVFIQFQIKEIIDGKEVQPIIKLSPPRIWNKRSYSQKEEINWNISLRVLYWFIKSHLELAYLMSSDKTTLFLPYIALDEKTSMKDVIIPKISEITTLRDLPKLELIEQ